MHRRTDRRHWEDFRATGRIPNDLHAPIAASWRRSALILPDPVSRAPTLPENELHIARNRARRFMHSAMPAVREAARLLDRSGNMVLLCDPQGIVIGQFGDPAVMDRGHENNLFLGGRWAEEDVGTNAIGMALESGRTSRVIGAEHYAEAIHRWSCAATPVHDPATGQLLGVVNISWSADLTRSAVDALSALLGYQAQIALQQQLMQERMQLADIARDRRTQSGPTPMAMLDRHGRSVLRGGDSLAGFPDEMLREHLAPLMPDLMQAGPDRIEAALQDLTDRLDVEVICQGDDPIGLFLGKRGSRAVRTETTGTLDEMAAIGPAMQGICADARRLAQGRMPLLIEGEAGVGKTTLARAIHQAGPDAARPFEVIDCAVLAPDQLRDALRPGGLADRLTLSGGTLCLDRPGTAGSDVQGLLPALLDRLEFAAVRVISLCGELLHEAMATGRFRHDLYFRLAGARLVIPPLRERRDEILPTLRLIERRKWPHRRRLDFTAAAEDRIRAYHWPGNLREMENLVGSLQLMDRAGRTDHHALPVEFHQPMRPDGMSLRDAEHERIVDAIRRSRGNLTEAARRLGIARSTLYLKMESHGIARPRRD